MSDEKILSNINDREEVRFRQLDKKHPLAGYQMKEWYLKDKSSVVTSGAAGVLVHTQYLDLRTIDEVKHLIEVLTKAWWWHEHLVEKNKV